VLPSASNSSSTLTSRDGHPVARGVRPFIDGAFLVQAGTGPLLRSKKGGAIVARWGLGHVLRAVKLRRVGGRFEMYPHTLAGRVACDVVDLPFFGGTLSGDVLWTLVLSLVDEPVATRLEALEGWVPVPTRELAVV
jgi:hypothetical protein